jgi:hypothetical protein
MKTLRSSMEHLETLIEKVRMFRNCSQAAHGWTKPPFPFLSGSVNSEAITEVMYQARPPNFPAIFHPLEFT